MNIEFDLQIADGLSKQGFKKIKTQLPQWLQASLQCVAPVSKQENFELSIRIVDENESAELNRRYRNKTGSTNVLSFPAELPENLNLPLLGDLVICAPVVSKEAQQQGKSELAHWAHMVIHGTLHLLGYDHQNDEQANIMEGHEISILNSLGFSNPYKPNLDKTI